MKNKIMNVIAVAAVIAPSFAQAGLGQDSQNLINASGALIGGISQDASKIVDASVTLTETAFNTLVKPELKFSQKLIVKGLNVSKDAATIVLEDSKEAAKFASKEAGKASRASEKVAKKVIKATGKVLNAALEESGTLANDAIQVSTEVVQDAKGLIIDVYNLADHALVGAVRISKDASEDLYNDLLKPISKDVRYVLDKTGKLIRCSYNEAKEEVKEVLGQAMEVSEDAMTISKDAVDASTDAVTFVLDKAGHLITVSADQSVVIIKGAAKELREFASNALASAEQAGTDISAGVATSGKASLTIIKAGSKTIRLVSEDIAKMFESEKE